MLTKFQEMRKIIVELVIDCWSNDIDEKNFADYYYNEYLHPSKWCHNWHLGILDDTNI